MDGGTPNQSGTPWKFAGSTPTTQPTPTQVVAPAATVSTPMAPTTTPSPAPVAAQPQPQSQPQATSLPVDYPLPDVHDDSAASATDDDDYDAIEWTASEFINHHKSSQWYAMLAIITVVLAIIVYALNKDVLSGVIIVLLGGLAAFAANRQPSVLPYRLDVRGLTIGARFYPYNAFKSFSVIKEGAFSNITIMPTGGFMPELSIYYSPDDEQNILEVLGEHLPMEQSQGAYVDRLARRLHF